MNFLTKIYSLWRQPIKPHNVTYEKYIPYFEDPRFKGCDNFPLEWHGIISKSPSASSCVSTISDFIEGAGFSEEALEKFIVNSRKETLFQVHQKTVKDFAEFEGFAWRFMFNRLGKITEWEILPFENIRLGKPDSKGWISKIYYNPYFGTPDKQTGKDTVCYDAWNPSGLMAQIQEQGDAYKGQVLFFGTTNALSRFYPLPEAHSAVKWMGAEIGISEYHDENLRNGMLQSFMLLMKGNPNEPAIIPDSTGDNQEKRQTVGELFDEIVSNSFMGAKRVANMWVHWIESTEVKPEILQFPGNGNGDLFLAIDTQATKKITIAFKVPAILANINEGVSLGGDGNAVRVAVKLMQQRVLKKQRMLTDSYNMILQAFDRPAKAEVKIKPYNPYPELEILDQKIWDALTIEERREWIKENTDIVLFDDDLAEQPQLPAAKLVNTVPMPFPEAIRKKIKTVMEFKEKMDIKCGGRGGIEVSEAILNNQNLGLKALQRIYRYLKKRQDLQSSLFTDGCEAINYHAWGGREMEVFLESKLKEIDQWLN